MKFLLFIFLTILYADQNYKSVSTKDGVHIEIYLANDSNREKEAQEHLVNILKKYELRDWIFTNKVKITDYGLPHSHPMLTLTTESEYFEDAQTQLSTFIHEQMHWFEEENENNVKQAIEELKRIYEEVPVGNGQGAKSTYSTYLHLIVCWLEFDAIVELYGKSRAIEIFESKDHYRWIFSTVMSDADVIGKVLKKNGLVITPKNGIVI